MLFSALSNMPCLRGVTVRVTDKEGNDLPEYGVQHLRLGVRGPKVSAYIQSKVCTFLGLSLLLRSNSESEYIVLALGSIKVHDNVSSNVWMLTQQCVQTDVQFQVSVQPRIPFIDADNPESESEAEAGIKKLKTH